MPNVYFYIAVGNTIRHYACLEITQSISMELVCIFKNLEVTLIKNLDYLTIINLEIILKGITYLNSIT
jgi:hypothetical protein